MNPRHWHWLVLLICIRSMLNAILRRVPEELRRHSLSDGGTGSYSTNLDRNRRLSLDLISPCTSNRMISKSKLAAPSTICNSICLCSQSFALHPLMPTTAAGLQQQCAQQLERPVALRAWNKLCCICRQVWERRPVPVDCHPIRSGVSGYVPLHGRR